MEVNLNVNDFSITELEPPVIGSEKGGTMGLQPQSACSVGF